MIIWGFKTRLTESGDADVISNACPECSGNLVLHDLKKWFTLYFIPVFPYSTIESCYKCMNCEKTFKQEIKEMLQDSKKSRDKIKKEMQKMFATTLAACMTHMASIDGRISREEKEELDTLMNTLPDFKADIKKTIEQVKKAKNNDAIFAKLNQAKQVLTSEGIMLIIAQLARVLLADGKINKKEEALMKEYLLVCGIPRDAYSTIIERAKEAKK
ncbi:TerB family tellurite resistance protein [Candidatus Woesearchaeota archaeon]|nr:TerB family tellurite resistance protein [Candidatus Woesearchaeota archaeon]MBW3005951.1 TerB family tellurite resistance protein [Candidatus Woesearchaeota archaeon]